MPRDNLLIQPGDPAPGFRLPAPDGEVYSLEECRRQGRKVALFFFRGTW